MSFRNAEERRFLYKVNGKCVLITRCKSVALDNVVQVRWGTIDGWQILAFYAQLRQSGQQCPGIWMPSVIEDLVNQTVLDNLASVHNRNTVSYVRNNAQVVGDVDNGHVQLILQFVNQVQNLCLDGYVQSGSWLVADQDLWTAGNCRRTHAGTDCNGALGPGYLHV